MDMLHINEHVEWDTNFADIFNYFNICPIYDSLYWLMNRYFSQPDASTKSVYQFGEYMLYQQTAT